MLAVGKSFLWTLVLVAVVFVGSLPTSAWAVELPGNVTVTQVDFERHVMGLFSRLGCNAGSCHGSFQGKGGFRLSLFGYDADKDYQTLTRAVLGRRIDKVDPDRSLFLLKATAQVAHGGGRRFAPGSWQYQLLRSWVATGATWSRGSGDVAGVTITPGDDATIKVGETGQVRVRVRFADDSEEDVTALCDFRAANDAVAEVQGAGVIKARGPGDTALTISYRGNVRAIRVLVPTPIAQDFRYPQVPEVNYVDREVFAKLRRLNVVPSELSGDSEFLRRVTIDTTGCLPTPEEVRTFLADTSADKRARKIEALLAHPLHAAVWATKYSDITGNNTFTVIAPNGPAQVKYSQMWHDWLRNRFAENVPYDEIVRGILCATSRDGRTNEQWMKDVKELEETAQKQFVSTYAKKPSLDLFWGTVVKPTLEQYGERTASAFMGIRLECAQCHKHPFDRWTQADYRAHANLFGQVIVGPSPETLKILNGGKTEPLPKGALPKGAGVINEVYLTEKVRALPHPDVVTAGKPLVKVKGVVVPQGEPPLLLAPKALGGPIIPLEKDQDARLKLFEWLRSPGNPYFARSFVNRLWAHYFGIGLVDPVDNFSLANPPSNEKLLDALARDFIAHKYDVRHVERTILNARVYQLSSSMNATNKLDRNNYAHSYLRPMMAEAVVDVLGSALGVREDFGADAPTGSRAVEVGASRILNPNLAYAFRLFGRPDRNLPCDCERSMEPALPQTLYLMTDPEVMEKVYADGLPTEAPKVKGKVAQGPPQEGRLAKLLKSDRSDAAILEELFLATLSRFPTPAEKKHFADHRAVRKDRPANPDKASEKKQPRGPLFQTERGEAFADALWALINTREFILNH